MKPKRPKQSSGLSNKARNWILIAFIIIAGWIAVHFILDSQKPEEISLTELTSFLNDKDSKITKLEVESETVRAFDKDDKVIYTTIRDGSGITFEEQGVILPEDVEVSYKKPGGGLFAAFSIFLSILLPIALIVFLFFIVRLSQGQGSQAMSFGRSKARLYGNEKEPITFKDIAGNEHAKDDLGEVVDFLKNPKKFLDVKAKIPKGVLLVGPPGTGKTMIARAVAGEAKVPFYSISGSEFVEMFVGVGASRVRDLFTTAKRNAPCIIFIDEIDAVGRRRGSGMGGGHDEREQTLNQILVKMDGFEQDESIVVLAATNRADVLDPALLRPGRFDRQVNILLPDRQDRKAILELYFKNKPKEDDIDIDALAAKTIGSSGADLYNIVNEAAIKAGRRNSKKISNEDVVEAFEKVAIGPARKNKIIIEKEKELTAYHEAGHAIVGYVLPDADQVHKVTIVSRGHAGGVTWFIPPDDKRYHSILDYKDVLARMLGGRMAEQIIYGSEAVTTGACNDLQKTTELARDMIVNQGMGSDDLRHQVFHAEEGLLFEKMMHEKMYSEKTAVRIDEEIAQLIKEAAKRAEIIIKANLKLVEVLKDRLLEKETVEAEELAEIFKGATYPKEAVLKNSKAISS